MLNTAISNGTFTLHPLKKIRTDSLLMKAFFLVFTLYFKYCPCSCFHLGSLFAAPLTLLLVSVSQSGFRDSVHVFILLPWQHILSEEKDI